jgi:hypothetical protein
MATWSTFAADAPELAGRVRARFEAHRHHLLATLRKDGSPRLSGTETPFLRGELWLGMMLDSLKALDLRRDPRYALHSAPIDKDMVDGDAKLAGLAVELTDPGEFAAVAGALADGAEYPPPDDYHLFRLDVSEVSLVRPVGDELVIDLWREGKGLRRISRR